MSDPDVITPDGSLASLERLYVNVPRKWPGYIFARTPATQLARDAKGNKAIAGGPGICAKMD